MTLIVARILAIMLINNKKYFMKTTYIVTFGCVRSLNGANHAAAQVPV